MKLFFRKYGVSGNQQVIILHGLFGISDNWATYGRRLANEGFEVFIPDQRNHGRSPHSDTFNYIALTEDLFDFIDDNEIENPVIVGHSMGGKVAMMFAMENPSFLKKLVVVDISLKSYGPRASHKNIIKAMKSVNLTDSKTRKDVEEQLAFLINEERIRLFILKNLYRNKDGSFEWMINLDAISANIDRMFDAIDTISKFTKPSLFVRGGNSDYITPEDFNKIRENFPNAEIVTVEGASHWVHAEAPEPFYQITYGFISGNPSWYNEDLEILKKES